MAEDLKRLLTGSLTAGEKVWAILRRCYLLIIHQKYRNLIKLTRSFVRALQDGSKRHRITPNKRQHINIAIYPKCRYIDPSLHVVSFSASRPQWRRYVVAKQCKCTTSFLRCTASCTACILQESRAVARKPRDATAVLFGLKFADNINYKFKSSLLRNTIHVDGAVD